MTDPCKAQWGLWWSCGKRYNKEVSLGAHDQAMEFWPLEILDHSKNPKVAWIPGRKGTVGNSMPTLALVFAADLRPNKHSRQAFLTEKEAENRCHT